MVDLDHGHWLQRDGHLARLLGPHRHQRHVQKQAWLCGVPPTGGSQGAPACLPACQICLPASCACACIAMRCRAVNGPCVQADATASALPARAATRADHAFRLPPWYCADGDKSRLCHLRVAGQRGGLRGCCAWGWVPGHGWRLFHCPPVQLPGGVGWRALQGIQVLSRGMGGWGTGVAR